MKFCCDKIPSKLSLILSISFNNPSAAVLISIAGAPSGEPTTDDKEIPKLYKLSNKSSNKVFNFSPNTSGSVGKLLFTVPKKTVLLLRWTRSLAFKLIIFLVFNSMFDLAKIIT